MKAKVVNIIPHPPNYESYRDNKPSINWNTPEGSWVGIWGYDFANLVGNEVLKLTDEFDYEVWQPDLRAKRIYNYRFDNGMLHKLIPAEKRKIRYGLKIFNTITSQPLIEHIRESVSNGLILHISSLAHYINQKIIKEFGVVPKVIDFRSKISSLPNNEMKRLRKNVLANAQYYGLHKELLRNQNKIFSYTNSMGIKGFKKYSPLLIERTLSGCDFDYWKSSNKEMAKRILGINLNHLVFSMASRFVHLKQIDKAINIFLKIEKNCDYQYKLLIAGHGKSEYECYLKRISRELIQKGKLIFTGYLNDEKQRTLYQASDLFISASTSEGGPNAAVKAIACEVPIMCTKVGGVDDYLFQNNCGLLVDKFDYRQWEHKIRGVLNKELNIKILDREKARKIFHWPNVAKKWIKIYRILRG